MNQIWFALMTIAFLIVVCFLIYVLLELRKSARALTDFLRRTEDSLKPALDELRQTLKSMRKVSDDVNSVTEDIRLISGSARDIGQNFGKVSAFLNEVSSDAVIKVSGLRVGIRTALEVLIKNLFLKKGGS
ncbi:MAG: hypothetical protein AUJ60_01775 [Nitrospirae bacterium CG1_02_44_142]|nr:MAG: hypothetical protein AUJ60_01775 [Nitrospirae bacterium CG1_02_44_142]